MTTLYYPDTLTACPRCRAEEWAHVASTEGKPLGKYCLGCGWPDRDRHEVCPAEDGACYFGHDDCPGLP